MARQQQAGRARCLRGEAETARGKRRIDLDGGKGGDQRATLQAFFQGPGAAIRAACLDDEKESRVDAKRQEPGAVRASPFARGGMGQAPQHEFAFGDGRACLLGDRRKGESERRRVIAIGLGPDLVQPPAL